MSRGEGWEAAAKEVRARQERESKAGRGAWFVDEGDVVGAVRTGRRDRRNHVALVGPGLKRLWSVLAPLCTSHVGHLA